MVKFAQPGYAGPSGLIIPHSPARQQDSLQPRAVPSCCEAALHISVQSSLHGPGLSKTAAKDGQMYNFQPKVIHFTAKKVLKLITVSQCETHYVFKYLYMGKVIFFGLRRTLF